MNQQNSSGAEIEALSMEIIEGLLAGEDYPAQLMPIIKRVVHASGDPQLAALMRFSNHAVEEGLAALHKGADVYTDVKMVRAGINGRRLGPLGGQVHCLLDLQEVETQALQTGTTRSAAAMYQLGEAMNGQIVAIGNAPTALFAVCDMVRRGLVKPALVVGTPVGFVGAAESKLELEGIDIPFITVRGTRGGSPIAASIVNALIYMI
ncbi:MAG: precorrin-8X methylmutase [Bacillota bacterium]